MPFQNKRGITLAATVMLIIFVSIVVSGVTIFITQMYSHSQTRQQRARALYLAQAGVHDTLYNFRFEALTGDGFYSLGQTNIDTNNYYVTGGTGADLLMVDTSSSSLGGADPNCDVNCEADFVACEAACVATCGGNNKCERQCKRACASTRRDCLKNCDQVAGEGVETIVLLRVKNATDSKTIWIDRIIATWDTGGRITNIKLKGCQLWSQNLFSPADADISDCKLNLTVPKDIEYLKFSQDMTGSTITLQFVMLDGSQTEVITVFPASNNYNFTVTSTGKMANSDLWRTIEARYNTIDSRIIDYNEINTENLP